MSDAQTITAEPQQVSTRKEPPPFEEQWCVQFWNFDPNYKQWHLLVMGFTKEEFANQFVEARPNVVCRKVRIPANERRG